MSLENHSAPGPAAGYTYQFPRAVLWLAKSPAGSIVGVETSDDVSVRKTDGSTTLEQNKHSIQEDAPQFGNRSKDLWNTLAIWIEGLNSGELLTGKCNFLMVTNKSVSGDIAKSISAAKSETQVQECVRQLKESGKNPSETIKSLTEDVLDNNVLNHLKEVIKNCTLLDENNNTSIAELRAGIQEHLQLPSWATTVTASIIDELTGWVTNNILNLWQSQKSGWIERDHFVSQLHSILETRKRQIGRERAANLIPIQANELGNVKNSTFVQQLNLITAEEMVTTEAIKEFIRCKIEKSRLSAQGNVTDQDWLEFEDNLQARWNTIFYREKRLNKEKDESDLGYKIFSETTDNHRERLAGAETEQIYLTAGSYHSLADNLSVGWHPQFEKLLKKQADD